MIFLLAWPWPQQRSALPGGSVADCPNVQWEIPPTCPPVNAFATIFGGKSGLARLLNKGGIGPPPTSGG
jgi:hypothetical protein